MTEELITVVGTSSNSIAGIARHVAGNLTSRFTDFLTSDGEKPWRHRDREFDPGRPSREEVVEYWEKGWGILFESLSGLTDDDLDLEVTIRGIGLSVRAALLRSLSHAAYHVGQIVFVAKSLRGPDWDYLTIPPGGSEAYNRNPTLE